MKSYTVWTGRTLITAKGSLEERATALFEAPFVVVSHGKQADPILNFGNRAALTLWEMTWEELVQTPSRLTAEPMNQPERERMLRQAATHGHISDYRGIRIAKSGRRFLVDNATVWNVLDDNSVVQGQAATFSRWLYVE